MQIFVRVNGKTRLYSSQGQETVSNIMRNIEETEGIAVEDQLLISSGKQLAEDMSLSEIEGNSQIDVVMKLLGGAGDQMDPAFVALVNKYIY